MLSRTHSPRQRGSTLAGALLVIVVCVSLASAVVLTNTAHHREAQSLVERERAFQLAEAGADWGLSQVRALGAALPLDWVDQRVIGGVGEFEVDYVAGSANGLDDDGDSEIDEADEAGLRFLTSTGTAGGTRRRLQVLLQERVEFPIFPGSVVLNVTAPIVDLRGNAFTISGHDHTLLGVVDPLQPAQHAIVSLADPVVIAAQIDPRRAALVTGLGGSPSIGQGGWIDIDQIVDVGGRNATVNIPAGPAQSNLELGTPTQNGTVVAYGAGDVHLSGGVSGAGLMIIDGDLRISGGFTWYGVIIVRGRVQMVGGGGGKRIIGAMLVGEEVDSVVSETEVGVNGTVDLMFSSAGIQLAERAFVTVEVVSWRELGAE